MQICFNNKKNLNRLHKISFSSRYFNIDIIKLCEKLSIDSSDQLQIQCEYIRGQFLENCAQLLHPRPKFLTAFSGEEVEHQKIENFYRHLWLNYAKEPN